jgi:hypothetical protein
MTDRHGVSETVHENRASLHRASAKRRLERRRSVLSCSDSEESETRYVNVPKLTVVAVR